MQIDKKLKFIFHMPSARIICVFLVSICIFHRFVNECPETRYEKMYSFVWTGSFFIARIKIQSRSH